MTWDEGIEQIRDRLNRLEQLPTAPAFIHGYFRVILEHLQRAEPFATGLLKAFLAMLEYEVWHHRLLSELRQERQLERSVVISLLLMGRQMRDALNMLLERLDRLQAETRAEIIVKELLRAECFYELGNAEGVVKALDNAIEAGCDHPLVYFAVGYNLVWLAQQKYVRIDPVLRQRIVIDREAFEQTCEKAIGAFRSGITAAENDPFDAQLYWWLGLVNQALGREDEATAAFEKAKEIDPQTFGEGAEARPPIAPPSVPEVTLEEQRRFEKLPELTDRDIIGMGKMLQDIQTLSDLLKKGQEN